MGFQGIIGRLAMVLLAVAISSCGGSGSSEAVTATPTFSLTTGAYVGPQTVTITDTASAATIYYTIDGTTPTTSSTAYVSGQPITVSTTEIVEAIAVSSGLKDSPVASATYEITPASIPTAGIWLGTDSATDESVIALINAAGKAIFIRSGDYAQFSGQLTVTVAAITAPMTGYSDFPATFADNSITGTGTYTGTVNETVSIDGSLAFTSAGGTSYPATFNLGYSSPQSTLVSSGTAVAGSYTDDYTTDPLAGAIVTITESSPTSATISSTAGSTGCVLTGTISTADTTTDVYEVTYSFAGCNGAFSALNGIALSGLAALNTSVSPVQLLVAVNGPGGGATSYGLVSSLSLQ